MKLQVTDLVCVISGMLVLVAVGAGDDFGEDHQSPEDFAVRKDRRALTRGCDAAPPGTSPVLRSPRPLP
ncbi:hypothetical protein AB5J52_39420 [Streptomyces sp. R39]|uniref:Uncharacterized protein n=1 Tax=Streptomyces sp. R39 TaxID=3238631 RepID=A0AB39R0C3_9ACTN